MNSFEAFLERQNEIKGLIEIIKSLGEPINEELRKKIGTLNRAVVVLLCSHIEGYIEDSIIEFIDEICKNNLQCQKIPEKLKVNYFKKDYDTYGSKPEKAKDLFCLHSKLWQDSQNLIVGDLDGTQITEEFNNPEPPKIKKLFEYIGFNELWNKIIDKKHIKDLEIIVENRHKIAHGDSTFTITTDDAIRYRDSTAMIAYEINRILAKI